MNWTSLGNVSAISVRDSASIELFRNRLWVAGGYYYGNVNYRDLFRGIAPGSFTQVISDPNAPFDEYARLIEFEGNLFAVRNTVWKVTGDPSSSSNWTKICDPAPWSSGLSQIHVRRFNGEIYAITNNGVWSSSDGASWTQKSNGSTFPDTGFACEVLGGKFYLFGGAIATANVPAESTYAGYTSFTRMLSSADGGTWADDGPVPFAPRMWPGSAVLDERIVMFGGFNNVAASNQDDTWLFDLDGWVKVEPATKPSSRHAPAAFVYNGTFFILGGNRNPNVEGGASFLNDLWSLG